MGIQIDHNQPYTPEQKAYLRQRGRGYLIPANERRFGEDGTRTPEPHEQAGSNAISPFYNSDEREAAVYDVGGAPLPNTVLDYNTGRVADRENGKFVEPTGVGHVPGAFDLQGRREPEGFTSTSEDDDDIDSDIVEHVLAQPNIAALKKRLGDLGGEYDKDDRREDLENKLAVRIQDLRDAGKDPFLTSEPEPDGNGADSTGAGLEGSEPDDEDDEDDEDQEN